MIGRDGTISRTALVLLGLLAGMASAAVVASPGPNPLIAVARAA